MPLFYHPYRSACAWTARLVAATLVAAGASWTRDVSADDAGARPPQASASMQCDRAAEPGRVKCSVEIHTTGDHSIAWADVALVEVPELATALKGRIGPSDATAREPTQQRWAFALIARRAGQGEVRARVRAVTCEPGRAGAAPRCMPVMLDVKALVHVG